MGKTYKKGNDGVNPRSRAKRKFRKLEKDYVKNLPKNIDEEDDIFALFGKSGKFQIIFQKRLYWVQHDFRR